MDEGFRTFDHTGDLGLEIWAPTPERLWGLAAEALMAQVAEVGIGTAAVSAGLDLEGDDPADLLVHWLNSVLLESELRRVVWTRAEVSFPVAGRLAARLWGRPLGSGEVRLREVKAVSHHALALDLDARPCTCRIVLDL